MKKLGSIVTICSMVALSTIAAFSVGCKSDDSGHQTSEHVHHYTCAHHPEVSQTTPGKCPKCGMQLVHKH